MSLFKLLIRQVTVVRKILKDYPCSYMMRNFHPQGVLARNSLVTLVSALYVRTQLQAMANDYFVV